MKFKSRPYQTHAVTNVLADFQDHDSVLLAMPTGTGKTEVFVQLMQTWRAGRCMVICPMNQLIDQAANKIKARTQIYPAVEQAGRWSQEGGFHALRNDFVVASKQSLCSVRKTTGKRRYERFSDIGLVIVDEAHLSVTPEYRDLLKFFRQRGAKILGVTATPERADKKALGAMYDKVSYSYAILDAVNDGWLVNSRCLQVEIKSLDLSKVGSSGSGATRDFITRELNSELEKESTIAEIALVTHRETQHLKTVVFCSSITEAQLVSERLQDRHGLAAKYVCSMPERMTINNGNREQVLQEFEDGSCTHLCNVGILTTGWDCPDLQAIVMARPTRSKPLYTQIYGRGTRPLPGIVDAHSTAEDRKAAIANSAKRFFKVVDLVDNSARHEIATSWDIFGGNYDIGTVKQAREDAQAQGEAVDMTKLLESTKASREALEEERLREREARKQLQGRAVYNRRKVNPYVGNGFSTGQGDRKRTSSAKCYSTSMKMPYGKHQGKKLCDLPDGYLEWMKKTMDNALGNTAAIALARKQKQLQQPLSQQPLSQQPMSQELKPGSTYYDLPTQRQVASPTATCEVMDEIFAALREG
jgi:superfamily II DNA or RNA helicase/uncharacterized protein (DUF3820 family)